ncbi:YajG family lipoprotein [Psychromonas sp. KJ10-2]|uniref:YajG family lipoprotein n=1 Tax=Psychromonas sp. KJ10-2 TaxID=3391822 RepID=UPI0039B4680F
MLKTSFKGLLLSASILTLLGCTATPSYTNITPQLQLESNRQVFTNQQPWKIDSQDLRIARYVIEISSGDGVATLINEQQSLRLLVEKSLTQAWTDNNLKLDNNSDYQVDIKLVKALAKVTESTLSYDASSQMIVDVALSHQGKHFHKIFRSTKQWDGAFANQVNNITEQLNKQLSLLLKQIVEDQELNSQLQQF